MAGLSERQALAARLPWVTRLEASPGRCEDYRWNHMPLKAIFSMGGRPPDPAVKEKYHCKNAAWWRFRPLRSARRPPGNYCWVHLQCQMTRNEKELARLNRAAEQLREEDLDRRLAELREEDTHAGHPG